MYRNILNRNQPWRSQPIDIPKKQGRGVERVENKVDTPPMPPVRMDRLKDSLQGFNIDRTKYRRKKKYIDINDLLKNKS